jgi:hypothetical protein
VYFTTCVHRRDFLLLILQSAPLAEPRATLEELASLMSPRVAPVERGLNLPKSSHKSPTEEDMLVTFVVVKAEAQLVADCSVEPQCDIVVK